MSNKLFIFFGTETGNSETVALEISDELNELGIENQLTDLSESSVADLSSVRKSLFVVSTWGEGEPPAMMEDFFYDLENGKAGELPNLEYAIVALGDTGYDEFCGCGRKIDEYLLKAGAKNYMDRLELDSYYDEEVAEWKTRFYPKIKEMWGLAEAS